MILVKTYSTFGLSGFDPIDTARRFLGAWKIQNNTELNNIDRFVMAVDNIGRLTSEEFYDIYTVKSDLQGIAENLRLPIEDTHSNIKSTRMYHIIEAARLLCKQIDPSAQYFDWGCNPTAKEKIKFESHLLWARIHFAESILLINTIVRAISNGRNSLLNKLENLKDAEPEEYIEFMEASRQYLSQLFPDDSSKSMIRYIINDWLTIINSFDLIGQKKSRLKEILIKLQNELQAKMDELPDSYTDQEKKVIILKNIFSKKILSQWESYLTENNDTMTEDQRNEFCIAYQNLNTLNIYPLPMCN